MAELLGRGHECEALDGLVADVLAGSSRVLVLRGEAGVGKSALLAHLSGGITGWRVASAVGVESEMDLAYSGLHQLCGPLLDHLEELPVPQRDALARLAETTQPCGTDLALGIEARCRALVSDGAAADVLYREAIDRLGRTPLRPDLARAHLLYGEWLRARGRTGDAREQLRTAHGMLEAIGMEAFAERARRELIATGETVGTRTAEISDQLTAQETLIARLARDGLSNPEIAAQLFLSARTIEWHLRKIFAKLGIGSRRELRAALPAVPHGPRT